MSMRKIHLAYPLTERVVESYFRPYLKWAPYGADAGWRWVGPTGTVIELPFPLPRVHANNPLAAYLRSGRVEPRAQDDGSVLLAGDVLAVPAGQRGLLCRRCGGAVTWDEAAESLSCSACGAQGPARNAGAVAAETAGSIISPLAETWGLAAPGAAGMRLVPAWVGFVPPFTPGPESAPD
jgi:hypothetical protein